MKSVKIQGGQMPQEKEIAETSEVVETTSIVEENADLDNNSGSDDVEFTDSDNDENQVEKPSQEKTTQTKEQNSEYARRRRENERQEELKKAREAAIIETLKGKNPYTDEAITDSADVEEYLAMRQIEESGGDPLTDYSKFLKQKVKKEKEEATKQVTQEDWLHKDRDDFIAKHPEVNLPKLIEEESFRLFAEGKVGSVPMTKIYEDFIRITTSYDKKAKQMAQRIVANANASPGSLKGTGTTDSGFYTMEQIKKMSQEEVDKNYEKIRESLAKINK